jgi:4'-phosphopantetheinyl transferase EntD
MEIDFGFPKHLFTQHFTTSGAGEEVLTANEKLLVAGVSEKRLQDFCRGRLCAKKALGNLHQGEAQILRGTGKEPLWPEGFVGSISHARELAGAVAARRRDLVSIGLDIEKQGRVQPNMWDMLFTPPEQDFLLGLAEARQVFYTTLFFSMKESFYKLQYPLTGYSLWFNDVEIRHQQGQFRIVVLKDFDGKARLPASTDLHFAHHQDQVISVCFMEQ